MRVGRRAGERRHQVALQSVTRANASEGYTETWTTYATVWASVTPATASQIDRTVSNTVQTPVSHLVEVDYRSDIRANHRVLFGARPLYIRGLQNVGERNITHMLACEERAS